MALDCRRWIALKYRTRVQCFVMGQASSIVKLCVIDECGGCVWGGVVEVAYTSFLFLEVVERSVASVCLCVGVGSGRAETHVLNKPYTRTRLLSKRAFIYSVVRDALTFRLVFTPPHAHPSHSMTFLDFGVSHCFLLTLKIYIASAPRSTCSLHTNTHYYPILYSTRPKKLSQMSHVHPSPVTEFVDDPSSSAVRRMTRVT